jgi:hypothetical protein
LRHGIFLLNSGKFAVVQISRLGCYQGGKF